VSFMCVLFVTVDSIGHMVGGSIMFALEGFYLFSLSLYRVLFVVARFVMFYSIL
jgi:hypothetical protein